MITKHDAYDEQEERDTIIYRLGNGTYKILGSDGELHTIDSCWAFYYIQRYKENQQTMA